MEIVDTILAWGTTYCVVAGITAVVLVVGTWQLIRDGEMSEGEKDQSLIWVLFGSAFWPVVLVQFLWGIFVASAEAAGERRKGDETGQ